MKKTGYKITDWIFCIDETNQKDIEKIISNEKNKDLPDEFVTWKLITVFLPLLTFLIVLILNITTNICHFDRYFSFLNNGSLPIISFSILTAGMPYLLEVLENHPEYHIVRRRVMSIALFFLFLSAALYIIQTLSIIQNSFNLITNLLLALLSIYVFLTSNSIGYKMFLLQSKNIPPYDENVNNEVQGLQGSLSDLE